MTQKESIEEALGILGGRAHTSMIYPLAIKLGNFSGSKNKKATIRNCLQTNPGSFRRSPGKPKGWWELISYQEEVSELKRKVDELNKALNAQKSIPTEADFVTKFLKEVMNDYKRKRGEADPIRNILRHMGHEEAAAVLDAWIDAKEEELKKALENLATPSINVYGDYVLTQNIDSRTVGIEVKKENRIRNNTFNAPVGQAVSHVDKIEYKA